MAIDAPGGFPGPGSIHFHEASAERAAEYVGKGGKRRDFFPHRIFYLPKCGPDGFKLAERMGGWSDLDSMWELVLFAEAPVLEGLPPDLFFDRDIVWHQQHLGRLGQVATANLVEQGDTVYSMVHQSDLVQRIGRRREHRTHVENRLHGWDQLLLNGILYFALQRGRRTVLTPSADLAIRHTDRTRSPQRELFERIYDRHVQQRFRARRQGEWWAFDVRENRAQIVELVGGAEPAPAQKVICVCHDVERDYGHRDVDPALAATARASAPGHLEQMLQVEQAAGVRATYSVVGALLPEVRQPIEQVGHSLAFHSFDHRAWRRRGLLARGLVALRRPRVHPDDQLGLCRRVDYRIRGYRPPQSRLTPDLGDERLCFHNFEWLASSARSLGHSEPTMQRRLVKIPIQLDDYPMYHVALPYEVWEQRALATMELAPFVAFSLHDCYGAYWLPRYRRLLDAVRARGALWTLDEVANEVILRHAWPGP